MKNSILCFIGVCFLLVANSQTSGGYIQVIAEDTLQLEPEEIIFNIYVRDYTEDYLRSQPKSAVSKNLGAGTGTLKKLSEVIKKMNIDTLPINTYFVQNDDYNSPKAAYSLRFTSKDKLKLFISQVSDIKGLAAYIAQLKSSQEEQAKNTLTKKLLEKAQHDAKYIAQQSNRALGELLSVEEESIEKSSGGWTMYPPLSAIAESYFSRSEAEKIIISRKLLVRFLW
jgi:hypothetical protein